MSFPNQNFHHQILWVMQSPIWHRIQTAAAIQQNRNKMKIVRSGGRPAKMMRQRGIRVGKELFNKNRTIVKYLIQNNALQLAQI